MDLWTLTWFVFVEDQQNKRAFDGIDKNRKEIMVLQLGLWIATIKTCDNTRMWQWKLDDKNCCVPIIMESSCHV